MAADADQAPAPAPAWPRESAPAPPPTPAPAILRIVGLEVAYGAARVLHGATLDVPRGGVTAIVGPNGVGKTTLINAVMGLVPVAAGRMEVEGSDLAGRPATARRRHGVALVPQGRRVFRSLSVEEHLAVAAARPPGPFGPDWAYATFPRLAERRRSLARTLSGGEQSMLAIARALATNPKLLLMDEPTEGLAPLLVAVVGEAIATVRAAGVTVLLVEQHLSFALETADRVAVMHRGAIDRVWPRDEIADADALAALVLGTGGETLG